MKNVRSEFRQLVLQCIVRAQSLYGVSLGRVTITFDLRGTAAAKAYCRPHPELGATYAIRFNREAISKDWEGMSNSTIPHEVAHLVAFAKPTLGAEGHNAKWVSIAVALGDTSHGERCHTLELTPARKVRVRRYVYQNARGSRIEVSSRTHRAIQGETKKLRDSRLCLYRPSDLVGVHLYG